MLTILLVMTPPLMLLFLATDGWLRFLLLLALVQESFPQNRALANGV